MVNAGVLYAITAGTGGITIAIILNRILSTEHKELIDRRLVRLLEFLLAFCIVDMIWGILTSRLLIIDQLIYTIFTYAFHLGAALSAFLWAGYVIHYLKVDEKYNILLNICRAFVLVVQVSVLVSNIWTSSFFSIDADANYHSYQLRNFMFVMQFLYYVALIVYSLFKILGGTLANNKDMRKRYYSALSFSCVPLAFGFGQMLWPDASMYSLGFMLTSVLIYSINISSEREEYLRTVFQTENDMLQEVVMGLSSDYQAIYLVDLDTDEYEVFGESDNYKENVARDFQNKNNFFEDTWANMEKVIVREDRKEVAEMLNKDHIVKELGMRKSYSFNYRVDVNDTEKYYLCKIIRGSKAGGKRNRIVIGVFDDDGRIRREAEQRRTLENALNAAKSASKAKTDFLFNMSHDIRTPMNSIIGFTNLAKKYINDEKNLMDCLEKVSTSGNHLLSLINDILDMSRIESGKMQLNVKPESISSRNDHVIATARELALAKNIEFNSQVINLKHEWILCDALRINQILLNILSNAVNYTNPGGRVNYTVEQVDLESGKISMLFSVADNGIGMSEEFLEKIFDEFERENTATVSGIQGTGLGMSIVKRLVELMGGYINISSTKGVGTTVSLRIDFEIADSCDNEESQEVVELPSGRRVLLVDDNSLNREIAVDILSDLGVECVEAGDGTEAVEILKDSKPGYFDLILMDVQMPQMDGYEATRQIRDFENRELAQIPIIAMTANAFDEDKNNAFDAGMNAHLSKPIDVKEMAKTMRSFMI